MSYSITWRPHEICPGQSTGRSSLRLCDPCTPPLMPIITVPVRFVSRARAFDVIHKRLVCPFDSLGGPVKVTVLPC